MAPLIKPLPWIHYPQVKGDPGVGFCVFLQNGMEFYLGKLVLYDTLTNYF